MGSPSFSPAFRQSPRVAGPSPPVPMCRGSEARGVVSIMQNPALRVNQHQPDRSYVGGSDDLLQEPDAVVCRFYQGGYCRRGSGCPFLHSTRDNRGNARSQKIQRCSSTPNGYGFPPPHPNKPPPCYPLSAPLPPPVLWQPSLPSFVSPHYELSSGVIVDFAPADKGSSVSAIPLDYDLHTASQGASSLRCPPLPIYQDQQGITSVPYVEVPRPAAYLDWINYLAYLHDVNTPDWYRALQQPTYAPSVTAYEDERKRKPFAYQTKPCRFFVATGKCSNGDKCTFIHDADKTKPQEVTSHKPSSPKASKRTVIKRPVESKQDDGKAKNFYPITWRVIGGGVMMGGQRQICDAFLAGHCKRGDDCKFAHETELGTDKNGYLELKSWSTEMPMYDEELDVATTDYAEKNAIEKSKRPVPTPSHLPLTTPLCLPPRDNKSGPDGTLKPKYDPELEQVTADIGGLQLSATPASPSLPHRRTRSMVGPIPPSVHPAAASPQFSAEL